MRLPIKKNRKPAFLLIEVVIAMALSLLLLTVIGKFQAESWQIERRTQKRMAMLVFSIENHERASGDL